jgi:iron complex transport system ATP-binding protein
VTAAVSCRQLGVSVDGARLLDGIDLDVAAGEWVTLAGPNGAGKTTLLRALAGLTPATGSLSLDGVPARSLDRRAWARRVALVPQSPVVPVGMRVADYVLLGRTPHRHPLAAESAADLAAAGAAIERLDLVRFAHRELSTLSGGERQRAVVARLLAQDAAVALLDEPTSALDLGHQVRVLDLLAELHAERRSAVVAAMHDLTLAGRYGDRVVLLAGGKVVADGPPGEVLRADVLSDLYGTPVQVIDVDGGLAVVPGRRR